MGEKKKRKYLCGLMILSVLGLAGNIFAGGKTEEVKPANQKAIAISAGRDHTCALISGGAVRCWGANQSGQLGDGSETSRSIPADVAGLAGGNKAVSAGGSATCVLTAGGGVECWGDNQRGQLGNGNNAGSRKPVPVAGLSGGLESLDAGDNHACIVTGEGKSQCWGDNQTGQLGDGSRAEKKPPVDVIGINRRITSISAGRAHTCALTFMGGVRCWGENKFGQLGDGGNLAREVPGVVAGFAKSYVALSAGGDHTCALTFLGRAKCWGNNRLGQLGDGTNAERYAPTKVSGLKKGAAAVSAGGGHTCVLTVDGGVKCWGDNRFGQLGDGSNVSRNKPVDVAGLGAGAESVSAGKSHTCALLTDGSVQCWGANGEGQLGDGTRDSRNVPVKVLGFGP